MAKSGRFSDDSGRFSWHTERFKSANLLSRYRLLSRLPETGCGYPVSPYLSWCG